MRTNWREVFKFFSGAAFASTIANAILFEHYMSMTLWAFTICPQLFGLRAIISLALFVELTTWLVAPHEVTSRLELLMELA